MPGHPVYRIFLSVLAVVLSGEIPNWKDLG